MDANRPACDVWTVKRRPVDILGKLMIRLDFQLQGWDITVHHKMCKDIDEAEKEHARLIRDLGTMKDGSFRTKYKIAHDLRGGF